MIDAGTWSSRAVRRRIASLGLSLALGCGTTSASVASTASTAGATGTPAAPLSESERASRDAALAWAQRDDAQQRARALELFERAAELDPTRVDAWAELAEAQHYLGRLALLAGDAEESRARHVAGSEAALRALPGFEQPTPPIDEVDAPRAAVLYWWAVHRVAKARLEDFGSLVLAHGAAVRALSQVRALERTLDHHGPDRELGRLKAHAPFAPHDHREAARSHLEAAAAGAPDYLYNRLRLAVDVAVSVQDRDTFERELRAVLEADPARGNAAADNRLAQREARALLDRAAELFE